LEEQVVVVLDVLRATTTMAAALQAGVREILVYPDVESVRKAKPQMPGALSCGEKNCLKPEDFDLGNSPGDLGPQHRDKTLLMSTTNGTQAILWARNAYRILTGAIVNARAVAQTIRRSENNVILLCAGTNGEVAPEDVIGAGAILSYLDDVELSDETLKVREAFLDARDEGLESVLRSTAGGQNIMRANLEKDIDFAARMNIFDVVGEVFDGPILRVGRAEG
jgi:2-phosphosulfolactate phosphatase